MGILTLALLPFNLVSAGPILRCGEKDGGSCLVGLGDRPGHAMQNWRI